MFGALKEFIATPANAKELSTSISSNPKVMMGFVSNPNYIPSYTEAKALNDLQSTVDAFEEFTNIILFLKQTSEWSK